MSTFEQSRGLFNQTHFSVIEIDLPVVEGTCTVGGVDGFGTPLSCDQASNATRTYKFTGIDAPLNMTESGILRLVKKISETPAKLNIDKGLASRGTGTITFIDDTNKDPNPDAPAVTQEVIAQGTFFGKLNARNELTNKALRIKNYRVEADGTVDLINGAETRYYIIESVSTNKKDEWSFKFKDELSKINIGDSVWPLPLEGSLRADINDTITTILVDANVTYLVGDVIRSSDELMKITGVSNIGTASASITVQTRGTNIVYTNQLTRTSKDEHSEDDELFVCDVSDNERIDDLLERILLDVGIDPLFIPKADWIAEIDEWHPTTRVNTIWIESKPTADILKETLTNFMIDMWFDPVDREVKISAISVWKESTASLSEGNEIEFESVTKKRNENLRSTRARVVYNKPFLTGDEEVTSYSKASIFKRESLEQPDIFGEPKTKEFEFTNVLEKDSADLLVNRWVNRFIDPFDYSFKVPERKRSFKTGDIVDTSVFADVGFDGLQDTGNRVQVLSVKPNYTNIGRDYTISALSYEPVFATGSEIVVTGNVSDVNLYIQYAGAPSQAVEITFVFDGVISSSNGSSIPSIRAGNFPVGSKLIIILANGADLMAKGGDAGNGGGAFFDSELGKYIFLPAVGGGKSGGTVFDAEGIDCDIYFTGATPSSNYPVADGSIIAPSGGGGGFDANTTLEIGGDGGNGGDGRVRGDGGSGGTLINQNELSKTGVNGVAGTDNILTGVFGIDGDNNNATGGLKGKGVVDNGATVVFFGDTASRYVNGGGSH